VQPGQQAVEGREPGPPAEDAVEPRPQRVPAPPVGLTPVGLEVGVEPPDQGAHQLLGRVLPLGEGVELVDQAFGVHPAQGVPVEGELAGVVGQDHRAGQEPVRLDTAPERAFGRDPHRIGRDRQLGDAEPLQVGQPGCLIREVVLGVLRQAGDHRTRQGALPHVGEGLGVDHVVGEAGAQHLEEVQPALRAGGGERGEVVVAELGADAVLVPMAGGRWCRRR
jgi:hypothetical protein